MHYLLNLVIELPYDTPTVLPELHDMEISDQFNLSLAKGRDLESNANSSWLVSEIDSITVCSPLSMDTRRL